MKLITYSFQRKTHNSFHYQVVESVVDWIRDVQKFHDGYYVLINVLDIDEATAKEFDGTLRSM